MINKYNDNKFETIGGYPTPMATNEEKSSNEYGLQYFKRMYHDWTENSDLNFRDKRRRMVNARKYAEGNQDVGKYKDLLDVQGDNSYMNIDWTPVSVVPKFVDVIVGDLSNQEYEVKASAIDKLSQDKKLKDKMALEFKMHNKDFLQNIQAMFGQEMGEIEGLPETDEELELYMKLNYKQAHEISLEDGIKFVFQQNDMPELKRRLLRDFVVVGQSATKTEINPSGVIKLKYVDPSNLITSFSSSPDFKNIQHAGEVYSVTISQLREMAGDEFTEDEYKYIAETYGKKMQSDDGYLFGRSYGTVTEGQYSQEYDRFSVEILDAEFITTHEMNYEKKSNAHGGYSVRKRKQNFKLPKNSKTKREHLKQRIKVVYKGKYIVGANAIFNYKLAENMMRPKSNLAETSLSYIIYAPNMYKMNSVSLVERMIPFADQIQLAHLKMQHVLAKARPKGAAFELGALENVSKGDGGTFSPLELQEIYDQTGNVYYRRIDDSGSPTTAVPVQELENGIGQDVSRLIGVYNHNLQMIRDVTGVNEARDASKPSSEALVGVQKMALLASNNATRFINDGYLFMIKRLGESVAMRLQDVLKYSKDIKGYIGAIGEATLKTINLTKDLSMFDFGIFLEVAPDEQEKSMLEQNIQTSLAQKELRLEDAIAIRSIKNIKAANQMLIIRRKKYQEEQMAIAQRQSENNAQAQQQSAAMAAQMKQQEVQSKAQMTQIEEQSKAQAQMELLKLEYDLKNKFEEQNHIRKMKELEITSQGKSNATKAIGDVRKESIAKSAHFQSRMIEQRKGQAGVIEDVEAEEGLQNI